MHVIRAALIISTLELVGCVQEYFPNAPHQSVRPGLAARVDSLTLLQTLQVRMSVYGIGPARVRRVLLTPSDSLPCHEGVREIDMALDGHRVWAKPMDVSGPHELVLRYGAGAANEILARPASLDLVLAGEPGPDQCLRVALEGPEPARAWHMNVNGTAGGTLRIVSPADSVDGIGAGWSLDMRLGTYAGPLRLRGEVGVGGAHCSIDCEGNTTGFLWAPLGASVHGFAIDSPGALLDVGLAYRFVPALVSGKEGERTSYVHGPELRLMLGESVQHGPGLPGGARVASGGYELFAAEWFGKHDERSFVLGIGFVTDAAF